ncbi:hypothetical protein [Arsenophonus endosymbiont of Aleurodicus floccissimus]|nr:hypothetical protein [Arsenophonus endosymbiont of Aleurodicus floccissimus]
MERKSVFVWANNEAGFVQAVIATRDFHEFKKGALWRRLMK